MKTPTAEDLEKRPWLNYFETLNHESAYMAGFIAADGCIRQASKNSLEVYVGIHPKDRGILEFWARSASVPPCRIRDEVALPSNSAPRLRSSISLSGKIASDLSVYGIGPRKSLIMGDIWPLIPEEFRADSIRGYFDGDGCVSVTHTESLEVSIRGTEECLKGIAREAGVETFFIGFDSGIHRLRFGSHREVQRFYDYIYPPGFSFCLARKKSIFDSNLKFQLKRKAAAEEALLRA